MFRCAVPSAITPRVSDWGPPSNHPIPEPAATKRMLAKTPRVPYRLSTFCTFVINKSAISKTRLRIDNRLRKGCALAASPLRRALTRSPIAKGSNIRNTSELPIFTGSTETPSSISGNTSGMNPTVTTMSNTIKPTAKARFALLIRANNGRNGAPDAVPNKSKAMPSGWSSRSSLAMKKAANGIKTKFARRARTINL